jgi:hypothetical protein
MSWRNNPAQNAIGKTILAIRKAKENLAFFCQYVQDAHPELIEDALVAGGGLVAVEELLLSLWSECWGPLPKELEEDMFQS